VELQFQIIYFKKEKMNTNKIITLLLFSVFVLLQKSSAQQHQKKYSVKGTATQTSDYCSGAYMPEREKELQTPKPLSGKKIFIKQGSANSNKRKVTKETETDSLGNFEINLPAGTYCIVEEYKTKPLVIPKSNENINFDIECIKREWKKADYVLHIVNENVMGIKINYVHHCPWSQPCSQYTGPLPASVAH
jgi:hypothetical protein